MLVLDSACNEPQNYFEFVPSHGWFLYIETSLPRQLGDTARLISPSTTEAKSCLIFFYHMYGLDVGELRVYTKSGDKMGLPVWSRSGNQGNKWYQAQVAVNNQTASYKYVIEGVRGKGSKGDIAIDDISLSQSCTAGQNQLLTTKPTSVDNKGSKMVTTTFKVTTAPAILPSQTTICCSAVKGITGDSNRIIITVTTVGASIFLAIVLIVLLVKYKLRKWASELSTPVNNPLETNETPPKALQADEESGYENIARVNRELYDDDATDGNVYENISAEGRTSHDEEVDVSSHAHKASGSAKLYKRPDTFGKEMTNDGGYEADNEYAAPALEEPQYETPGQNRIYEELNMSQENPGYTELDKSGRNATDDGTYQELLKRDSDYVIPAHERRK